jgi:hypothetical protein
MIKSQKKKEENIVDIINKSKKEIKIKPEIKIMKIILILEQFLHFIKIIKFFNLFIKMHME